MKRVYYIVIALFTFGLSSCMKDNSEDFFLDDFRVEFEDAVIRNNATGLSYPLVPQVRNNAGLVRYQVNLVGGLISSDQQISVKILTDETTAVEGTHYSFPNGLVVTIPANEAFGFFEIEGLTLSNTSAVRLVIELEPSATIRASANHKRIGIDFRQ